MGVFEPGTFVEVVGYSFTVVVDDGVASETVFIGMVVVVGAGDVTVEAVVLSVRIPCVV